jgi:hypothetical protein
VCGEGRTNAGIRVDDDLAARRVLGESCVLGLPDVHGRLAFARHHPAISTSPALFPGSNPPQREAALVGTSDLGAMFCGVRVWGWKAKCRIWDERLGSSVWEAGAVVGVTDGWMGWWWWMSFVR